MGMLRARPSCSRRLFACCARACGEGPPIRAVPYKHKCFHQQPRAHRIDDASAGSESPDMGNFPPAPGFWDSVATWWLRELGYFVNLFSCHRPTLQVSQSASHFQSMNCLNSCKFCRRCCISSGSALTSHIRAESIRGRDRVSGWGPGFAEGAPLCSAHGELRAPATESGPNSTTAATAPDAQARCISWPLQGIRRTLRLTVESGTRLPVRKAALWRLPSHGSRAHSTSDTPRRTWQGPVVKGCLMCCFWLLLARLLATDLQADAVLWSSKLLMRVITCASFGPRSDRREYRATKPFAQLQTCAS